MTTIFTYAKVVLKIGQMDQSLENLSEVMVIRIRETYKQSYLEPVYLLFSSQGFSDFINRVKYVRSVQNHDKNVFVAMEQIKLNYDTQKNIKEDKQAEVENLKMKMNKQKSALAIKQLEKQKLLELTRNDEKKYQDLLQEALQQKQAFRRFVTEQGGASILNNQTKCDDWGCYFNQRDATWGNQLLGNSDSTVAEYGCFVTSSAMVASYYKKNINNQALYAVIHGGVDNDLRKKSIDYLSTLSFDGYAIGGSLGKSKTRRV